MGTLPEVITEVENIFLESWTKKHVPLALHFHVNDLECKPLGAEMMPSHAQHALRTRQPFDAFSSSASIAGWRRTAPTNAQKVALDVGQCGAVLVSWLDSTVLVLWQCVPFRIISSQLGTSKHML